MDTSFASNKVGPSMRGFTCAQLFVTDFVWCKVKPMKLRSELPLVLKPVFKENGITDMMICDGVPEQVSGEVARCVNLKITLYNSSNVEPRGQIGRRDMLVL